MLGESQSMSLPPTEEWDFERLLDPLSDAEIRVCYHYEYARELGAESLNPNLWREVTLVIPSYVPQEIRQKLTGHASDATNERYTHHDIETLRKAISAVPKID